MPVQAQTFSTRQFREWSGLLAWGTLGLLTLAIIISPFLQKKLIDQTFAVFSGDSHQSDLIKYNPGLMGALRVDARAKLPKNHWATYELQILDESGVILASGIKQSWRDAGRWSEGGESGTWDESDTKSGFALKVKDQQSQSVRIAVEVLESGTTANTAWEGPVSFNLEVHDGSIDIRYMWLGFFGTLAMAILTTISSGRSGKKVIAKSINDSDVGDRATLGGAKNLIQVRVYINSDETSPQSFNLDLAIRNPDGTTLYQKRHRVPVRKIYDEGVLDAGSAKYSEYFLITPRDSYGFYVEVTPDQSVDRTHILVTEKVSTRGQVMVTRLEDSR